MTVRITKILSCECCRCKHKWIPILDINSIMICPKCKSAYWNKMRKKKIIEEY